MHPRLIDRETQQDLLNDLVPISAHGFMRPVSEALCKDVADHVFGCGRLTILTDPLSENRVGFIAANVMAHNGHRIFHLGGMILDPPYQANRVGTDLLTAAVSDNGCSILAFHTQNVAMEKVGEGIAPFNRRLSIEVAQTIGTRNLVILTSGDPIDKGRYPEGCLYGDTEKFAPLAIKRPGFEVLDGDAIVFAGYVNGGGTQ